MLFKAQELVSAPKQKRHSQWKFYKKLMDQLFCSSHYVNLLPHFKKTQ
jgi:hypothetical protein